MGPEDFDVVDMLNTPVNELQSTVLQKRTTKKLDYYNRTYKGSSYSRSLALHACPRKFELDAKFEINARRESVTFAYGHAVGAGVQYTIAGYSLPKMLVRVLQEYDYPMDTVGTANEIRSNKSLWSALMMSAKFWHAYNNKQLVNLNGWEIAKFKGEAGKELVAVELTFVIDLGDGFTYEGHVDLILYNPVLNRYLIVELKTTGSKVVDEASYRNSAQALGYSVVVDTIAGDLKASASFDVLYYVAKSVDESFIPLVFTKTPEDKAKWIMSIITDKRTIEMYEDLGFYPQYGESCYNFFRRCDYYGRCHQDNSVFDAMTKTARNMDSVTYTVMESPTFFFTLDEIIARQEKLEQLVYNPAADVDALLSITNIS